MRQHAMRTAVTLYEGGTLDLETAARQAGVTPARLRRAVRRSGGSVPTGEVDADRIAVASD
jgi:hypothetical protein